MRLWPRLPLPRAKSLALSFAGATIEDLASRPWQGFGAKLFAPTGGVPVDDPTLRGLRKHLEAKAEAEGYPDRASQLGKKRYDDATMKLLADLPIAFGEALRPEMWAWVSVILVPHLVRWRWADAEGGVRVERFAGSLLRNAFGRLWYQAAALADEGDSRERWQLIGAFGADQTVALLERPSLAASRRITLAVGRVWSRMPPHERKEGVFREAMKRLIVRAAIQRLELLDEAGLEAAVSSAFKST